VTMCVRCCASRQVLRTANYPRQVLRTATDPASMAGYTAHRRCRKFACA
jgi:hypothetical protein